MWLRLPLSVSHTWRSIPGGGSAVHGVKTASTGCNSGGRDVNEKHERARRGGLDLPAVRVERMPKAPNGVLVGRNVLDAAGVELNPLGALDNAPLERVVVKVGRHVVGVAAQIAAPFGACAETAHPHIQSRS